MAKAKETNLGLTYRRIDTGRERAKKKIEDITQKKKQANNSQLENAKNNYLNNKYKSQKSLMELEQKLHNKLQNAEQRSQSQLNDSVRILSSEKNDLHSKTVRENHFYIKRAEVIRLQEL